MNGKLMDSNNMPLIAVGNKFAALFQEQINFQRKVEKLDPNFSLPADDPIKFQYHMLAMLEELGETLKADKRWKTHRNTTHIPEEKLDELADCYITLMNVSMWSNFSSDDILEAISIKIAENHKRIDGRE